ncbi:MAG: hydroxymethylbilane synthase [Planctomycetia bacterium]|nr:hydroxymethylbilane synthase [Planctomycetia bacterium]
MGDGAAGGVIRLGTRGSALAMWQARRVTGLLEARGRRVEIVVIKSSGDATQDRPVEQIGVGVFTKELEDALLERRIDVAVHSLKDLPSQTAAGLALAAVPEREDPRDAVLGRALAALPPGGRVATSSPRRQQWLARRFPALSAVAVRGNVDTRVRKLEAGEFEALLMAVAGLKRLGLDGKIAETLGADDLVPPAGQAALAVETRSGEESLVRAIDDASIHAAVDAERALFRDLRAGCRTPLGAHAAWRGGVLRLDTDLAGIRASAEGSKPEDVARKAADLLRAQGGEEIVKRWR